MSSDQQLAVGQKIAAQKGWRWAIITIILAVVFWKTQFWPLPYVMAVTGFQAGEAAGKWHMVQTIRKTGAFR